MDTHQAMQFALRLNAAKPAEGEGPLALAAWQRCVCAIDLLHPDDRKPFHTAGQDRRAVKGNAISLFDESGNMVRPWARSGWHCYCFDILNAHRTIEHFDGGGFIAYVEADLDDHSWHQVIEDMQPDRLFSFSPCDDVAVCGAKHFAKKLEADPECQNVAVARARLVEKIADRAACRWMHENPISMLSTLWRKPDFYFNPSDYGGYLPEDDIHPRWPEYIAPRDAYPKKTGIRCGNDFVIPEKRPVPALDHYPGWKKLGGKSAKTKQIRSETPRGYALAVYEANAE